MEFLTAGELAERIGVQISAVSNWRKRFPDFPRPVADGPSDRFDIRELRQWLKGRRIPRQRLTSTEVPGTTYGDRLQSELPAQELSAPDLGSAHASQLDASVTLQAAMDRLRHAYPPDVARELLVALVYIRVEDLSSWAAISQVSSWSEVRRLLRTLAVDVGDGRVPLHVFHLVDNARDQGLLGAIQAIDQLQPGDLVQSGGHAITAILDDLGRRMGRSGGQYTPPSIARCLIELLDPQAGDMIYDPVCGSGELLVAAANYLPRARDERAQFQLFGGVQSSWGLVAARANLAVHDTVAELRMAELEHDGFAGHSFDVIVANPPFGKAAQPIETSTWPFGDPGRNTHLAWLQHVYRKLAPNGRAAVVLPAGAAFNRHAAAEIRARMVETGVVECVVSLPAGLFTHSGVKTMIWVICGQALSRRRPPNVMMVDTAELMAQPRRRPELGEKEIIRIAERYRFWRGAGWPTKSRRPGRSCVVDLGTLRDNEFDLSPRRYCIARPQTDVNAAMSALAALEIDYRDHRAATARSDDGVTAVLKAVGALRPEGVRSVLLGQICDVLSGPGAAQRPCADDDPRAVPLVLPRNIRDGRIIDSDLDRVDPAAVLDLQRYVLQAGDVVTARVGTLGRFGFVDHDQSGWILGPSCLRLRPGADVDPRFLMYLLETEGIQGWIAARSTGSAIRTVNAPTLRAMPVSLPSLLEQRTIAGALDIVHGVARKHARMAHLISELGGQLSTILTGSIPEA